MSLLSQKHLQDEQAAYKWVETHVWPDGPKCPHCGEQKRVSKMKGKATRIGLYKCYRCRKQFNVKIGTIFEKSHVKMHIWLQAFYLICGSKKGISSHQLHRTLGVTLKTAWFMGHRIREAMRSGSLSPMGGGGGIVEADETYFGQQKGKRIKRGGSNKFTVLTLVDRIGEARSFKIDRADMGTVIPIVRENIDKETTVMTDEATIYKALEVGFEGHETVVHSKGEYGRGEIHTNTVEGFFSIFKRGMKGIYQHCGEQHLHRYLSEYDFRYNNRVRLGVNDEQRTVNAVKGIVGKRLTYRTTNSEAMNA